MVHEDQEPLFELVPTGISIDKQKQEFTIKTNALTTAEINEMISEAIAAKREPNHDPGEVAFRNKIKERINRARDSVLPG